MIIGTIECCVHTHTCYRLMYRARTDFINSITIYLLYYTNSFLMSCRHRHPVHYTSHINAGIMWFLMLTIIYNINLIVYVDRNKTLYLIVR